MTIEARIPLTLPKVKSQIIITYNTYEEASFDQYLTASIVVNAHSKGEIENYIDDITGKGSLNKHLKKLVEDIMNMDETTRTKVLNNSIYPVTRIDKKHSFTYYPFFDVSIYKERPYNGNLKNFSKEELRKIFNLPSDIDIIEFKYNDSEDLIKDQYTVKFENNDISIKLTDKNCFSLSSEQFQEAYHTTLENVESHYKGVIQNIGNGNKWSELTKNVLDALCNDNCYYYDNNGNHLSIKDRVEITQLINVYGLYLYKKERIEYTPQNRTICQSVIKHLISTQQLFDFPQNWLLKLTKSVDELTQQMVINHILIRREDSDIAEIGIGLLAKIRDGWEKEALRSMKYQSRQNLTTFYTIDHDLDYTDEELSRIDETVLSSTDKNRVSIYRSTIKNKIKKINELIGIIMSSGIRERMKEMKATEETKILTKGLNIHIAHKKGDINRYTDSELDEYLSHVEIMYQHYQEVEQQYNKTKSNLANKVNPQIRNTY